MPARWLRTVCRSDSESSAIPLELEQVVERLSRVVAARCRRFALDGGARREEGAGVAGVLRRDARGQPRVHALEPAAGIERHALRAGVEIGAAPGAPRIEPDIGRHGIAALRAAHDLAEARHVEVLRAVLRDASSSGGRTRLRWCSRRRRRRGLAFIVLVAALPVLPFVAHRSDCPSLIPFSQLWYKPWLVTSTRVSV